MAVTVKQVSGKKGKKAFIDYEWTANKKTENWVSPLRMDRQKTLDTDKNPFFEHAEIALFLAYKEDRICGRIAAIVNRNHNVFHNDDAGFWGFFDCENDQQTADALFDAAGQWLENNNKSEMIGPVDPSTNDPAGMLIDGFDSPPFVLMRHNPPYYPELCENYGMAKAKDLYAWYLGTEEAFNNITEKMERVAGKIMDKYNLTIRNIKLKELDQEILKVKEVYNNAWSKNWGFVPFTDAEINHIADDLKQIADEDLLFMAEKEGKPIGFSITLPNINEVLARIPDGKLFPSGIFKLLTGLKKIETVRVLILGVNKEYQFLGLGSIFYIRTIKRAYEKGYKAGEMSWILEDNLTMNRAIESLGSKLYKKYRIYGYSLK